MPSSTRNLKFLLDENVRIELSRFLKSQGFDYKLAAKGATDKQLASISKAEKRILVTNDEDFQWYTKDQIHCAIWLWIPQNDPESLITSFKKLIKGCKDFSGNIITLTPKDWNSTSLYEETTVEKELGI